MTDDSDRNADETPDRPKRPVMSHDTYFRGVISNPRRAAELFYEYLPEKVVDLIDRSVPPRQLEGNFVDADGARTQCDALFEVTLRTGQTALALVVVEHKSFVDLRTPIQIARYMLDAWQRHLEENGVSGKRSLPKIYPLVIYHGAGKWTVPLSLAEMIDAPDDTEDPLGGMGYTLCDLRRREPGELARDPELLSALLALQQVFSKSITEQVLDLMTAGPVDDSAFQTQHLHYLIDRMNLTRRDLIASLQRTKPDRWETLMGTIREEWEKELEAKVEAKVEARTQIVAAQSLEKGLAAGEAKGMAETLKRQLKRRFGPLPRKLRDRIDVAEIEEIETWLDAVLDAPDLSSVFDPKTHH